MYICVHIGSDIEIVNSLILLCLVFILWLCLMLCLYTCRRLSVYR